MTGRMLRRDLGPDATDDLDPIMAEGRTIATITPRDWLSWDYNKD